MPHLVILYTGNLDAPVAQGGSDIDALCRSLADAMLGVKDEAGKQVFPTGGSGCWPTRHRISRSPTAVRQVGLPARPRTTALSTSTCE